VKFVATHPWLDAGGQPFGPLDTAARSPIVPPDSEGIAFDCRRQLLYGSSEGERLTGADAGPNGPVLLDPWIRIAGSDGGTWASLGPTLPDGRPSVVLVSDDNFSPTQITQFLAFAM
jgi:hypothetical protein